MELGTKNGPQSGDLMTLSDEVQASTNTSSNSAFTRVSHQSLGVIPVTTCLREDATPTPASSTGSESPPTLRRAKPLESNSKEIDDEDLDDREDESSNQGDNAFAWPTHNSYDEQR